METTTLRSFSHRRSLRRRLVLGGAAVAATAAIGLGLTGAPASAEIHNPCATARAASAPT